jgi:two-component sensor histidine kinase
VAVRLYSTSDGLSTNQMNGGVQPAGALSKSGELWFPSTKGVVTLAPGAGREGTPPSVVLEQALVDDRNAPIEDAHLRLAPGRGKLELHYTAIRLRSPERLRFRYWMEGLEPEWTQAGERRVAYFTNIPPGDYRFHVAAYDVDDPRRVVEQVLSIHWQPPFFRSWWFIALCGAAALGLVWTAYGVHTRNVRKRFAAVLDERNRVAREMHDTVIQGCVGVSALLEAASSAQETSPAVSRAMLERARDEIRVTVEDARSAVWNLRRAADGEDIADAISRLVHRVGADSGIAVELKSSGTPIALGADAERSLLLSVREAVWNAVRHASPRHIAVALAFGNRELTVAIEDDGSGFDCSPDATREATHYGLIGMRERVEKLGGSFDLSSRPGAGTCVRITIPHHGLF